MASLLTPEGLSGLVFLLILGITVAGAVIATNAVRLVRCVAGLALCFIGVAGIYYYLQSPFVAVMQMLIYVGAVCVTISFAIMLADPEPETNRQAKENALVGPLSLGLGVMLFWGLAALAGKAVWLETPARDNNGSMVEVGKALLTTYSMVFELISVVLLLAIIGSLALAHSGRGLGRRAE